MLCPSCHAENKDGSRFCSSCASPLNLGDFPPDSLTKTREAPFPLGSKDSLIGGKYLILEEVGRGGMGVVYKAEDTKLKRLVALKFMPPHLSDSTDLRERFLIEAQAAAALSHPNICVIHEVGETEETPYIAMEYVEGETLRSKVKEKGLTTEKALDITSQLTAGLGEAHSKGIIHRDIKSANIMVTAKGRAKILDFGLAKLQRGSSLTKSQTTLGTVAYMSPEQARGDTLDTRTDIWSLGVVLYEMLTGDLPFKGDQDQAVIHSILHREPKSLKRAKPGAPPGLERILLKALAKKPSARYQTMEELGEDIEAVREGLRPLKARYASRSTIKLKRISVYAVLGLMAILIGLNVGGFRDRLLGRSDSSARIIKLAVLPFVNLTGESEHEYFSDGITQEMITEMGRLHSAGLSVIGSTSVMRYKNGDTPVDQIGRELGVDYVLEGSTLREANIVRITAHLITVRDQTQLWGDTYSRELSGILKLQSDVAKKVAEALALKLLPGERARLADVESVNPEAHDAYLKGFHHWKKLTKEEILMAQRYFQLSLEKDPTYAPAYHGIALVWGALQQMGYITMKEAAPKARAAALKAVELDDNSAEAHFALALIKSWIDWDWAGAEPEWQRALDLNPNHAETRAWYAHFLAIMGRIEEAIVQGEKAIELDPFNATLHSMYAGVLNYARRYSDAEKAALTAHELQQDGPISGSQLERALIGQGRYDEVIAMQREYYKRDPKISAAFERGLEESGYKGAQKHVADLLASRYIETGGIRAQTIAETFFDAGDIERTIEWFEKAFDNHEGNLPYINRPYYYDRLRSEPRYLDLLRRMGLPVEVKN